jgi:hypothetical protein
MNYTVHNQTNDIKGEAVDYIIQSNAHLIQQVLSEKPKMVIAQEELQFSLILSVTSEGAIEVEVVDGDVYVNTGVLTKTLQQILNQTE